MAATPVRAFFDSLYLVYLSSILLCELTTGLQLELAVAQTSSAFKAARLPSYRQQR